MKILTTLEQMDHNLTDSVTGLSFDHFAIFEIWNASKLFQPFLLIYWQNRGPFELRTVNFFLYLIEYIQKHLKSFKYFNSPF